MALPLSPRGKLHTTVLQLGFGSDSATEAAAASVAGDDSRCLLSAGSRQTAAQVSCGRDARPCLHAGERARASGASCMLQNLSPAPASCPPGRLGRTSHLPGVLLLCALVRARASSDASTPSTCSSPASPLLLQQRGPAAARGPARDLPLPLAARRCHAQPQPRRLSQLLCLPPQASLHPAPLACQHSRQEERLWRRHRIAGTAGSRSAHCRHSRHSSVSCPLTS